MRTGERPAAISVDHHSECTDDIHGVNVALYQLS